MGGIEIVLLCNIYPVAKAHHAEQPKAATPKNILRRCAVPFTGKEPGRVPRP